MELEENKQEFPTLEEWESMTVENKVQLFTHMPLVVQKLLVGCSAFASSVRPEMAIPVSKLNQEEFEKAKAALSQTPFFSITENGRLQVVNQMKTFINTDLRKVWEEQKAKQG